MENMLIDIGQYLGKLIPLLQERFGERLLYVGLQGSYLRGEATENSDMDIMVLMDGLCVADLDIYRTVIQSLEGFEQSCGFICGKKDLENWNPLEICNLLFGTKDYYGELRRYVPEYTRQDIRNFVRLSVNNLYHEICHRYIHATRCKNEANLPHSFKGVFFILQNLQYLRTGSFPGTKKELLECLEGKDRAVLERAMKMSEGYAFDFQESFSLLFAWCQDTIQSL